MIKWRCMMCSSMQQTMYAVITLQDSDELMVVPSNWLSLDMKHCYWPPFKSTEKCMEAVQNKLNPETEGKPWEKLRIIFLGQYDTFEMAKEGQKEYKEWSYPLDTIFPGLKRQKLESTQGMSNNQLQPLLPASPVSTSRMSADDKVEILQMPRDIKSKVQQNSTMLKQFKDNTVSKAPSSTCVPSKDIKANLKLPLRTFEDVTRTEMELKNATTRQKYTKYFSRLGGFVPKDVIKNIMQQVLTDDLAMQYNWRGRGNKKPFSQLILTDVIRDAALNQNINRGDCETEIKKYLSYAPGRKKSKEQGGIKRKREPDDLNASTKLDSDMTILKGVKQLMAEVKTRIQNINSTVQTTTEQKNNILDAIAKMDDMDKDNKRKETIGVFGKTGEGKSFLLNTILGLDYLLPSGSFGACTSVITQVEANLTDSNYTAEIELISKEEWENEIASEDSRNEESITAVYGADADKKTLEELKEDDKYAEIDNLLSAINKKISHTVFSEFKDEVARYIQHNASSPGGCYWPLVKRMTIKIPDCHELLEHIVLLDIPGTGDCNKIRDELWKTKLSECSSVWVVSDINRAITDRDPWGIIQHCIQDLGPGGECKNINFICTRTDVIDPIEYIRSLHLSGDKILNSKTECILHRNNRAKTVVKKKFENLEIMKTKARFVADVFTVSSKAYLDKKLHLEPIETEIPKLQEVLKKTNMRINRELIRDYVNEAKGVLSFIQSIQLDTDEKMVETKGIVHKNLEENLAKALKELGCEFDSLYKIINQCLSKGVGKSVELCVDTKNKMIESVAPNDRRGFHKTLQALYKNKGRYWPKNWDAPLDLNMCLAKHMHDNINAEFNLIFPVDDSKTGMSVQEGIDKFSIIQSDTAYSSSSMLYHMENFIKAEETKVKALLKKEVVQKKKKIYSSIETTIQNQMTAGYEQAAKLKGNNAMKKREKKITETIEQLKHTMFKAAKKEVLNQFKDLREDVCKTLESELKRSVERSLSQTTKTTLMDVSSEIEMLEAAIWKLSD